MATSKRSPRSSGFLKFLLGFVFALVVILATGWAWLRYGNLPVAIADKPFPFESQIVQVPLGARIDRQMQQPPFGISEDVYETGAMAYKLQCASCHGMHGKPSTT